MVHTMEELAEQQTLNGGEIQRIITNYKKDPEGRKDKTYFIDRLRRLEDSWAVFEAIDSEIRAVPDVPLDHPYFSKDYYDSIKSIYCQYSEHFTKKIELLVAQEANLASTKSPSAASIAQNPPATSVRKSKQSSEKGAISKPTQPTQNPFDASNGREVVTNYSRPTSDPSWDQPLALETQAPQVCRLIRRQRRIFETLRRLLAQIEADQQERPKQYLDLKITTINQQWSQFQECDHLIWELTEDPAAEGYDIEEGIRLEEKVEKCLILLTTKRDNLQLSAAQSTPRDPNSAMKLPKFTLPKFDGDYLKWKQFHDLFEQMVHSQAIPNCQKMWYLKANLSGEAEKLIRHFTASDENYAAAWQTLKDRYNNQRLLITALISKLLSQPGHANEDASVAGIKTLHDTTQECLLGLKTLNVSTADWDPLLLHILIKKLDKTTHMLYEQSLSNPREIQSIKGFLSFLETRFQSLEALGRKTKNEESQRNRSFTKGLTSGISTTPTACISCKANHPLFACSSFRRMSVSNRLNFLRKHNLCINCLKFGHNSRQCTLRGCTRCNQKHNTLVHLEPLEKANKPQAGSSETTNAVATTSEKINIQPSTVATLTKQQQRGYILLGTAIVKLATDQGDTIECRAILDSGSQVSLITEKVVKKLRLSPKADTITIYGVGNGKGRAQHRVNISVKSTINEFSARLEAFVLPRIIPPQPAQSFEPTNWNIPKNIKLADPKFNISDTVDLLLGAELYHQLLSVGQIRLAHNLPILQNTVFGWVLAGKIDQKQTQALTCGICTEDEQMDQWLKRFWQLEEVPAIQDNLTQEEKRCETFFNQTVERAANGRFIVSLPFREDPGNLGESRTVALNRFFALERRLAKDTALKSQYVEFMREYIELGHMKEVDIDIVDCPRYFIPHHCVLKPESSTTKLRVVFDASMKTTTQLSLNDVLYTGPTIQSDLFSILLRFRLPRFVFTADIQKMYRQVLLKESDQKYQLIFWRNDPSHPLKCYQLCTVTYGTRPAPYLATKCLQKLAQEAAVKYPLGAEILRNDFYVDDCITGSNSLATVLAMQKELKEVLQEAGFKLRKWSANSAQLLEGIPPEDQEINLDFGNATEERIKTLGLTWLPKTDQFRIKAFSIEGSRVTKRIVTSDIAKLFDPLGILAPVVVSAKIFAQQLWSLKIDWDSALPMELHTRWVNFRTALATLNNITIPRHVFAHGTPKSIQIHVFSDASEKAFGAALYVRSINKDGRVIVRLLCSKSRVAPLQKQTLPRLELCAALLAAQLTHRVKKDLKLEEAPVFFWSDSEIVLAWINSTSASFHTFVANRIAAIQELSIPSQWRHVRSKENPADVLSRGLSPEKLEACQVWFYGPPFLHGNESIWPTPFQEKIECQLERKRVALPTTTATDDTSSPIYKINHGGSFRKLQRIVAYILRFVSATRHPHNLRPKQLSPTCQELDEAMHRIVKNMQQDEFKEEISQLTRAKEVNKNSSLSSLTPFLDKRGIIRVGGRLKQSSISYDAKHPMLLPYSDPLTKLLMLAIHKENLHSGAQALLADTRQRFWPIKGKIIARSIVQHCTTCARAKPKMLSQLMGDLPATRVQPARPFVNTGVDFCGPIWIHHKLRGKRPDKAYISVFCCFATKAVHLEIVSDLSTEAFLGALRRFVSRRGNCRNIYCDNATNFVGARNQLEELTKTIYSEKAMEDITGTCNKRGIDFHFIPPRAPHFGGLWEAAVKSAKHLLFKTASTGSLTYEELETLVIEIEAILNSRPLTQMSNDPNDLTALTPGHFLIGEPLTATIDANAERLKTSLLRRWKLVSHLKQEFWKRWSREYLNELQHRFKWKERCQNIEPGTIVIVQDDNLPVMKWPLGRIVETHKGDDGLVRVADVKTATGTFRRAIHRLSPLPCDDKESQSEGDDILNHKQNLDKPSTSDTSKQLTDNGESSNKNEFNKDQIPRKRLRNSYGTAIVTLLLTCLILPTTNALAVEVEYFASKPGIYFENMGTTSLIATEWNLVVYYDLEPYWTEFSVLLNGTNALQQLCGQIKEKQGCGQIVKEFKHLKEELENDNRFLTSKKQKRGAIDIIGNIANSLFGVLDSEYAKTMSETIDAINENEDHLLILLKNQTSIIDSTINIMKKDQSAVERKFEEVDKHMQELEGQINRTREENYELKIVQLFTSLSIQMSLIASNLRKTQTAIIDVLTDIHHGRISPLLVTPQQLSRELIAIKNHLPPSLRLPTEQNILQLYKTMSAAAGIANKHAIIKIQIPLVSLEKFDVFKMTPIPVLVNDTLMAIRQCANYIAFTSYRDQYFTMTDQELSSCISTEESGYLCPQNHPLYHKLAHICTCEVTLFNKSPLKKCEIQKAGDSLILTQLKAPNQWIFATRDGITVNTLCENKARPVSLSGSGLLKLSPGCVIKHDLVTVRGTNTYPSSIKASYTRSGDLGEFSTPVRVAPTRSESTAYKGQQEQLETLKKLIASQLQEESLRRPHPNSAHQFTIGYLALAVILVIILIVCVVLIRYRENICKGPPKRSTPAPTPAPRKSKELDFSVNI